MVTVKTTVVYGSEQSNAVSLTSTDAVNWNIHVTNAHTLNQSAGGYIKWLNNQYIMLGENSTGNRIFLTSKDAVSWNQVIPTGIEENFYNVTWDGYYYIATSAWLGYFYKSTDLVSWTKYILPNSKWLFYHLYYYNGLYFVIGSTVIKESIQIAESVRESGLFTSNDGIHWNEVAIFHGLPIATLAFINQEYIIFGGSGLILTSMDGKNWTNKSFFLGPDFYYGAYGSGEYVFPVNNFSQPGGMDIYSTSDFFSWKRYIYQEPYLIILHEIFSSDDNRKFSAIAFDGSKFVVVGYETDYFKNVLNGYTGIVLVSP